MDFASLFSPITYNNSYVNPIVTNFNMRFTSPIGPIYNFGSTNSGSIFTPNFTFGFNNCYYGGNPFGNSLNFPIYNFTGTTTSSSITSSHQNNDNKTTNTIKHTQKTTKNSKISQSFTSNASKYLGYNEKDGSSRKFSDSGEWCADFVTYVVKESYKEKGLKAPDWFGHHRTEILRQQAKEHDSYLCLTDKSDKAKTIKEKVNIGDIMILRENGASHTGFVSKINKDGSFETIEGNRGDAVSKGYYKADDPELSGFVQLNA